MKKAEDAATLPQLKSPLLLKLRGARFTYLLAALSLLLLISPVVGVFGNDLGRALASTVVVTLFGLVLVAAALAVNDDRRHNRVTLAFAVACGALTLAGQQSEIPALRIIQAAFAIGFLMHVIRLVVYDLFRSRHANYDTIAASLCGFLLIGVMFAITFALVAEIDTSAFSISESLKTSIGEFPKQSRSEIGFGDQHTSTSLYFSFVTLTTLGYGDITPVSIPARTLAMTEAVIGQIYLVVLVARLVGLQVSKQINE